MIQAVRCHQFAALEVVQEETNSNKEVIEESKKDVTKLQSSANSNNKKKRSIRVKPRKQALSLRQVLSLDTIPSPTLQRPNDVLIQTKYAGVQYPDALQARGLYQVRPPLPYIPCMDATGIVIGVGSNAAKHVQVGDRVMCTMLKQGGTGACAEIITSSSSLVYKLPHNLHLSKCANIGRNYFAAYHSLKTIGKINEKALVLVDGASGGVGMASIELAKAMGAKVIAGVSTADKVLYPKSVGADVVLTYGTNKKDHYQFKQQVKVAAKSLNHPNGVDLVIDMVQGDLFENALISTVKPLGTICLVGFAAGQKSIRPGLLLVKEVNVVGSLWGRWAMEHPMEHRQNVHEILNYLSSGKIEPRVDRVFALKEFYKAFELFEQNQGRGNTAICFDDNDNEQIHMETNSATYIPSRL